MPGVRHVTRPLGNAQPINAQGSLYAQGNILVLGHWLEKTLGNVGH